MKPTSFLLLCLLPGLLPYSSVARAQSDEVLTARSAKNTVLAEIDQENKCLRFLSNHTDVDDIQWEFTTKEEEPLMLVKDNTYNLRMRLNNPLKYRITVEGKVYEEDTYDKAINDLAASFQAILTTVTRGAASMGTLNAGDPLRQGPSAFDPGKAVTINPREIKLTLPGIENPLADVSDFSMKQAIVLASTLNDKENWWESEPWGQEQWVEEEEGGGARKKDKPADRQPTSTDSLKWLIEAVAESVKRIETQASYDVLKQSATLIRDLVTIDLATSGAKLKTDELDKLIKEISSRNDSLALSINGLAKMSISDIVRSRQGGKTPRAAIEEDMFGGNQWLKSVVPLRKQKAKEILRLALQDFAQRMTIYLGQRQRLVTNLRELMQLVQSAEQSGSKTENGTELIHSAVIPKGKTEVVTVTIKERTFKVENDYTVKVSESEQPLITHKLKFMRSHLFYPQAFPAAVFINDVFPEYTAQEDSLGLMRVGMKENSQGYFNLAGMVNFNIKMDRKTEVPFLQIGASAKKSRPQAFVGAGVRFTEWFCISMGAAMTWQSSLGDLGIGDKVANQDAIDKDLRYRMSDPKFYFSIQLRPSTITKKP